MTEYRKRPVVIDAIENTGTWQDVVDWLDEFELGDAPIPLFRQDDGSIMVQTSEGDMRCNVGDFLIRGVKGEFYPCKPDIFATTYEVA